MWLLRRTHSFVEKYFSILKTKLEERQRLLAIASIFNSRHMCHYTTPQFNPFISLFLICIPNLSFSLFLYHLPPPPLPHTDTPPLQQYCNVKSIRTPLFPSGSNGLNKARVCTCLPAAYIVAPFRSGGFN